MKKRRQKEGRVGEVMGKDIRVRSGLRGGNFVGKRGWGGVLASLQVGNDATCWAWSPVAK